MKILLMGHIDGFGGAQTAFRKLVDFTQNEGHIVKIITITDTDKKNTTFTDNTFIGQIAHHAPSFYTQAKKFKNLIKSIISSRNFKPDIFITVGLSNSANLIARCLNNTCFKIGQDFIAGRSLDDKLLSASSSALNGIAVQSPSMLDIFRDNNKLSGVNWLPCFPELPEDNIQRDKGKAGDAIRISYFGRLAGNKGLSLLLQALANPAVSKKITLDIWGKGTEAAALYKLSDELQLNKRVFFKGAYPAKADGAQLMASYDALVLTSTKTEGLPLILIEAMAYGIPFLATDIGAIKDCFIDNKDAILVKPTYEGVSIGLNELTKKIHNGQFDSDRLKLYYKGNFSYQVMAHRWRICLNNPVDFFYEQ